MKHNFKLKNKNQTLTIMPFSDIHYGSPNCDVEYFEFMLEKFKNIKGEKIIYMLGDECDIAVKRQGNSTYAQQIDVNEQIEYIIKSFRPFSKYINGMVQSNHMARPKNELDLDVSKVIADALDIPYKINIRETLRINNQPYKVYVTHGTRTASQLHLMLGTCKRGVEHIDADLYLMGHCHQQENYSLPYLKEDGYGRRHYVLCGHMLEYFGGYAEIKGYKPNPPGFTKISIDANLRTSVDIYNKDECEGMVGVGSVL